MGRKCCVIFCKSGYECEKKKPGFVKHVPVYSFPKNDDQKREWISNLPKSTNIMNITQVTKFMGVCRKHFRPDVPMRQVGNNERPAEPPEKHLNEAPTRSHGEFN